MVFLTSVCHEDVCTADDETVSSSVFFSGLVKRLHQV